MGLKSIEKNRSAENIPLPSPTSSEASVFKRTVTVSLKGTADDPASSVKSRLSRSRHSPAASQRRRASAGEESTATLSTDLEEAAGTGGQGGHGNGEAAERRRLQGAAFKRPSDAPTVQHFTAPANAPPPAGNVGQVTGSSVQASQEEMIAEDTDGPQSSGMPDATGRWHASISGLNLLSLVENPRAHDFTKPIFTHVEESARLDAKELTKDHGPIQRFWNKTATAQDIANGEKYRKKLAALTMSDDDPTLVLDAIRDVADTIIRDLRGLKADTTDEIFVKNRLIESATQLKISANKTAFKNADNSRLATTAMIVASNLGATLPFYAALAGNPFGSYYLVSLAGAYARIFALAVGLMRTQAADARDVKSHFVQRHITWEVAPLAFVATNAARQYYVGQGDNDHADYAQQVTQSPGLVAAVALISLVLYVVPEFTPLANKYYNKAASPLSEASRLETRFNQGEMALQGQQDLQKKIHGNLAAVATLVSAVDLHRTSYNAAGGPAAAVENEMMSHMRQDLYTLVEGFSKVSEILADDEQRAVATPVSGRSDNKRAIAITMTSLGAALGLVSSLSSIKAPGLLADYSSYYFSSCILISAKGVLSRYNAEDVIDDFIARFGGTTVGAPTAFANTVTLLAKGEGIFDLVRNGITTVAPANNATIPAFPGTMDPNLHPALGALNFTLGATGQFLLTAVYGTRAGPFVAKILLQTVTSPQWRRLLCRGDRPAGGDLEAVDVELEDPRASRLADALIAHIKHVITGLLEDRSKTMGDDPQDAMTVWMDDQLKQRQERLDADDGLGLEGLSDILAAIGGPSSSVLRPGTAAQPAGGSALDDTEEMQQVMSQIRRERREYAAEMSSPEDAGKGKEAADPAELQRDEDQIREEAMARLRATAEV